MKWIRLIVDLFIIFIIVKCLIIYWDDVWGFVEQIFIGLGRVLKAIFS